jgi:hypothetical protein
MGEFNMPPGVSTNMIPGNRPEDMAEEAFWQELDEKFLADRPEDGQRVLDLVNDDEAMLAYVLLARDLGHRAGYICGENDAGLEHQLQQYEREKHEDKQPFVYEDDETTGLADCGVREPGEQF